VATVSCESCSDKTRAQSSRVAASKARMRLGWPVASVAGSCGTTWPQDDPQHVGRRRERVDAHSPAVISVGRRAAFPCASIAYVEIPEAPARARHFAEFRGPIELSLRWVVPVRDSLDTAAPTPVSHNLIGQHGPHVGLGVGGRSSWPPSSQLLHGYSTECIRPRRQEVHNQSRPPTSPRSLH